MKKAVFIIFTMLFFYACINKTSTNKTTLKNKTDTIIDNARVYDTIAKPFDDQSYQIKLHIFDRQSTDADRKNSVLTFSQNNSGNDRIIFKDSLYCFHTFPYIQLSDMNKDGIKDVLISSYSAFARANITYHLYLVDTINHKLKRVKGFEDVVNPEYDTKNNIIASIALSGSDDYSFYRIDSQNQLINLGHGFEVQESDEVTLDKKYNGALKQILKEKKD